ncbi:MAG: glycoside hydrolase family 2 protein [Bryobacteraceae bacterium]
MLPALVLQLWTVQVEEPTGIYRREAEVVAAPVAAGRTSGFRVTSPDGRELPWQAAGKELLFPASVIPGQLPRYRIACCGGEAAFPNTITARETGMRRVEIGNSRFRVVIDRGAPAIIEAYALDAGPQRTLNLVEGAWSALGAGPLERVEILESGPLRGRVRLSRAGESWEFTWTAGSPALRWRVRGAQGFRFASVSALPYEPFDRFADGSEYQWPLGPEESEPPDHAIGARAWKRLPGGHGVYYRQAENYGALGIVALDERIEWRGIGSASFEAGGPADAEIALTFPAWKGNNTVLEARRENRILRQPLLVKLVEERAPPPEPETAFKPAPPETLSLDGPWELAWGAKGAGPASKWRMVRVPGTVHAQILTDYYTPEANWVSGEEWWYRKTFRTPSSFKGRRVRLQFDATDYYADAWLNGHYLGRHEGYIDPYEYDVARYLNARNTLLVRVWTPVSYYWRHRPYTVKGAYGAVDQKPDDITPLGITRSVRLVASAPAVIRDVAVDTRLAGAGAEVEVQLEGDGPLDRCRWELRLRPRNFESGEDHRATVPGDAARALLRVPEPRLWWTWDHGAPNLYTLEVRLTAQGVTLDSRSLAVGIREIDKIGWNFYLNRKRLFIRGTNYYFNLFLSEMDSARYQRDMRLMLGMNVNMIRLHCHFTNPEFYDLADESGVLLWQDYLEAWYPHDRDFALRAAALYDPLIRYARNHPSVALWATSDEEDLENYRVLTKHLAARAALLDPQRRPVVRSTGRSGDAHVYYGWYGGSIWQYTTMDEPFVSELGATALPNYESLVKFLPDHWPIRGHEQDWVFHKLQIPEAMRAWGEPGDLTLKEYIPRTQAYVARLFQIALERARRQKYRTGGILHFHAIDIWPSVTMAAVDFYRVPTKAYEVVRRSFAPVLASIEYDRDRWKPGEEVRCGVWAINDEWRDIPGAGIRWRIPGTAAAGRFPAAMEADSARKVGEIAWRAATPGNYELRAEVVDAAGSRISENVFEFEVR